MGELVDHDVVALGGEPSGLGHVVPRQHHRSALHRFARQLLVPGVHDAVIVFHLAAGDDRVGMDDDADETIEPLDSQRECRPATSAASRAATKG